MTALCRLGRDAELRYLPSGAAVLNLAVCYNYGQKQQDGTRKSQWLDCVMFGKQAEALAQYLLKGTQLLLTLEDVAIQTFESQGQTKSKLNGRVLKVDFVGGGQRQEVKQQEKQVYKSDADSDIPF
jgi:single-strand DNA-binding protein